MRYLRAFFVAMLCALLWGCIENDTVIHVKPDGSGLVEETFMMSNTLVESLRVFSQGLGGDDKDEKMGGAPAAKDPVQEMMKDAESRVSHYGPDAKFVSVTPSKTEEMTGYKAAYAFNDINKLRINQNPENKVGKPEEGKDGSAKKEEIIRFSFVKGPVSSLTVTMPADKPVGTPETGKEAEGKAKKPDPEAEKAVSELFKGMRIMIALKIDGTIVRTNASYRDKTLLTLFDIQFSKIIENKAVFEKLTASQPKTIEAMKALVKQIDGLKVETNSPVVVEFK
jgi:hypothetical protein